MLYIDSLFQDENKINILNQTEESIPVCVLSDDHNVADFDQDLSMDVLILKTFDSLTSYEQHLLKSSSILGDCFPRAMLLYVMSCTSQRQAALGNKANHYILIKFQHLFILTAVEKLFEIRVLSCARGDFQEEGMTIVFRERLTNPDHDISIKCGCLGIDIEGMFTYIFSRLKLR